jgi:hypothetical protein
MDEEVLLCFVHIEVRTMTRRFSLVFVNIEERTMDHEMFTYMCPG